MRFWLLTNEYPPQSGGGISTYCWHTAKMFAGNGVEVTVFTPTKQSKPLKIIQQEDRVRIVYFKQNDRPQNRFLGWETALSYEFSEVLKAFEEKEGAPDFIEAHEYSGIAYYPLQRRLLEENYLKKSIFYVTAHAPGFLYLDYNQAPCYQLPEYWIGEMEKSVLKSADFVISPSQYLLNELQSLVDLSTTAVHVIRNPFVPYQHLNHYTEGELVFFGKLTPQKGGLEMLEYLKDMWDSGFEHRIRIVGEGDHFFYPRLMDMGKYVKKRFAHYIEKGLIVFEGHISPGQIETRLANAHVIIIPSTVDNLPYTVLEGMSLGKVVLASEQGGHAELIRNGFNGFTFSHHVPDSFSSALNNILKLQSDEINRIGLNARNTIVQQCSYAEVFSKKIEILQHYAPKRSPTEFPFIRPRTKLSYPKRELKADLLTVVVPFYNLGKYLEDCIKSVFATDYPNKEVIVIDDGSSEKDSIGTLADIESRYDIKVLRQKNLGISLTRNKGAQRASGEFLAFLDADDTVHPSYYTKAVKILKKFDNVAFVGCWAQYFGENNDVWPSFNPEPPYLLTHNMMNSSALIFKTGDFLDAGGNDPALIYGMEDYEAVLNLVKKGFHGVVVPEILWHYRIRSTSMAQAFNRFSELYLYRLISRKHADFLSEYTEEVVNILNANGPGINYKNPSMAGSRFLRTFTGNSKAINLIRRNRILRKLAKTILSKFSK